MERWDDAEAVRDPIIDKQVKKNPSYSWIENKIREQAFMVDDYFRMVDNEVVVNGEKSCYKG